MINSLLKLLSNYNCGIFLTNPFGKAYKPPDMTSRLWDQIHVLPVHSDQEELTQILGDLLLASDKSRPKESNMRSRDKSFLYVDQCVDSVSMSPIGEGIECVSNIDCYADSSKIIRNFNDQSNKLIKSCEDVPNKIKNFGQIVLNEDFQSPVLPIDPIINCFDPFQSQDFQNFFKDIIGANNALEDLNQKGEIIYIYLFCRYT